MAIGVGISGPRSSGGGEAATLDINGVFSDAGHTTLITDGDSLSTVYILATPTGITPTEYTFFVLLGTELRLIGQQASNSIAWEVDGFVGLNTIYVLATDGTNEVWNESDFTINVGLLDQYSPLCVLALRKFISSATVAIRVRRDSDNTETDINFVGYDIDTATIATFCSGTNGFVTTTYDQTGNELHATNVTLTQQPKIYDSGTGVVTDGILPALSFDGVDDELVSGHYRVQNNTSFIVGRARTASTNGRIFGFKQIASLGAFGTGNTWGYYTGVITSLTGFPWVSRTLLYVLDKMSGTSELGGNASSAITFTGNPNFGSELTLGGSGGSTEEGDVLIQAYVGYSSDQSANRTAISNIINNVFSIY